MNADLNTLLHTMREGNDLPLHLITPLNQQLKHTVRELNKIFINYGDENHVLHVLGNMACLIPVSFQLLTNNSCDIISRTNSQIDLLRYSNKTISMFNRIINTYSWSSHNHVTIANDDAPCTNSYESNIEIEYFHDKVVHEISIALNLDSTHFIDRPENDVNLNTFNTHFLEGLVRRHYNTWDPLTDVEHDIITRESGCISRLNGAFGKLHIKPSHITSKGQLSNKNTRSTYSALLIGGENRTLTDTESLLVVQSLTKDYSHSANPHIISCEIKTWFNRWNSHHTKHIIITVPDNI